MTPPPTFTSTYGSRPNSKVDVYLPSAAQGKLPTVLFFHGGGIVTGDRGQNPIFSYWLADGTLEKGWVFLSAGYSLLPKHTGYDILDDVQTLLKYLRDNEEELHVDSQKIIVVGASGGAVPGRLAAAWAEPKPLGFVSMFGMSGDWFLDHWVQKHDNPPALCASLGQNRTNYTLVEYYEDGSYLDHFLGREISSILRSTSDREGRLAALNEDERKLFPQLWAERFPPTFLAHGILDSVVPKEESEETERSLKAAGVDVSLRLVEGVEHGFLQEKDGAVVPSAEGKEAHAAIFAWIVKTFS
ncbi:alpha/beta-hydrolase [Atractiella rhizophila]|nr:alpha/beta-hydrolase [Atractiella rhizophila]KAH8927458.1 alpha/beta-hydrolase [Atractiella rhizophila]